ncbi:conserved hypothetical protein [Arcobacter nitrofigilis DSM 7299]|uniref:Dienelactone hydrolase domain-containing protein n=1 Tax=Arcobacter nitrofigilis (strain ATCC 33309 / DSM 7299 / CCUG 15893 / LMG 7604 / NCTC 12251 / CI) TaxID=572480 RepID=D5V067_ARCNC|nr:hypothetical protein [Arcobacter nitrofigilis]ADG93679.1 conserved hypothetical protein [Arcobacter nitrofigilis DSM 7299]
MNIILVSDVFGKTPALEKLGEELNTTVIVDPYDSKNMDFKNEAEAYSYFMDKVGLDKYLSKLLEISTSISLDTTLIGFSVGASVIWKLSANPLVKNISCGICYYGSQIRNFKEVNPLFEVELIFPKMETHFDVLQLQSDLCKKENVKTSKVDYLHGFMNSDSTNYNKVAYLEQLNYLLLKLQGQNTNQL